MEKERDGINLLKERHQQTVMDLVDDWYSERLSRINYIKKLEIDKITITTKDSSNKIIKVIKKTELERLENLFNVAIDSVNKIKNIILEGYSDSANWYKLIKIHNVNVNMTSSLLDLDKAERQLYSDFIKSNVPFPSDFIDEKVKKIIKNGE